MPRDISKEYTLSARLPWECNELLNNEETRTAKEKRFWQTMLNGRKKRPTRAAVVAAVLLWYQRQTEQEKEAILLEGIDTLNAMIEEREPPSRERESKPIDMIDVDALRPKKGRRA